MTLLELARSLGRWLILLLALLGAAEMAARAEDALTWGAPMTGLYGDTYLTVRDTLGVHGRANFRYQKWRMNNEGFRGADIAIMPSAGRTRIALLGASETFGLYESEGHEYALRLQSILDSTAPGRFEVVNVGLPGLSLSSMVPYYRNLVARLHPAYVLIYPSPSFYLEVNPLPPVYTVPPVGTGKAVAPESGWRLVPRLRQSLKSLIPPSWISRLRLRSLEQQRARHPEGWIWGSVPTDRMATLNLHLEHLVDTIVATGATPVLVTHTNRFVGAEADSAGPDGNRLTDLAALYYPQASKSTMVRVDAAANAVLRKVAAERNVPVIEVEGRIPPNNNSFADYAHFTDSGAEAMARLLATGIMELGPKP